MFGDWDNNPKSPWISVKDDLPCNHKGINSWKSLDASSYAFNGDTHYFDRMTMIEDKWYWQRYPQAKILASNSELQKKNRKLNY